jgi:hypothetical protein
MGWSCRQDAANTLKKIEEKCRAENGSSNSVKGHFFETARVDYDDGRITGEIFKMGARGGCAKVADFTITGGGDVQGPGWFKKLAQ